MKALVAWGEHGNHTDGHGNGDFNWCNPYEPVVLPHKICDNPSCGCGRSFTGIVSRKGTTKALVVDLGKAVPELIHAIGESYETAGFTDGGGGKLARQTLRQAERFEAGTIVTINVLKHDRIEIVPWRKRNAGRNKAD